MFHTWRQTVKCKIRKIKINPSDQKIQYSFEKGKRNQSTQMKICNAIIYSCQVEEAHTGATWQTVRFLVVSTEKVSKLGLTKKKICILATLSV